MISFYDLSTSFDEDHLPPGQQPIVTNSLREFLIFVDFIMQSKYKNGYSTMGVVTGLSGIGKTIAIQTFLNGQSPRPHIGLPACIVIKVTPGSPPKALLEKLLTALGERPRGLSSNRYKIADEAAEAIVNNDVKVLFVDEADLLSVDCFEFLRYIFGKTGCPIVIVGLRQIWRVVNRYEKFANRVGLHHHFLPPNEQEVLETILPQLTIPHWRFDPTQKRDMVIGQTLWDWVQPSFRNLRTVLQYASLFTELQGKEWITLETLQLSYRMTPIPKRREALAEGEALDEEEEEEPQTDYEKKSVLRQQAKEKTDQEESF
jgi:hypothetical protein